MWQITPFSITGSGQGTITSNAAHLSLITDRVPGLFDTGMGSNCLVLADGRPDPSLHFGHESKRRILHSSNCRGLT